ncbi:hypothetical protein WA026_018249 [Henosepilachna vigintioctopunctata]|uniref:Uncharacterized protein n=1 Tax=Henosepilachna vigintioctopunctata TaxID=420089 RepID=A0AAW1VE03_9CUCU
MSGQFLCPPAMDQTNWTFESKCPDKIDLLYFRVEETLLQLLIGCEAHNKRTAWGDTPLHIACSEANSRCIEGILLLKPNTNIQNQMLYTPLNLFLNRPPQNEAILRKLLEAGANPNIADADGYSPLHILALQLETDRTRIFARLLVEYEANVNSFNNFKETPLHIAIDEGNEGLIDILLESGASINFEDKFGRTPMNIALEKRSRHPTVFERMSKHLILRYYCGFPVNLSHLEEVLSSETIRTFKKKCEEEIQQLKSARVEDSTVTFYNILVSCTHAVARFLFNLNVLVSLQAFDGRKSIFGPVLNKKFNEALERFHVLQIGIFAARKTFPFLPDICIDKLMEYLDIDDFINLHECSRISNSRSSLQPGVYSIKIEELLIPGQYLCPPAMDHWTVESEWDDEHDLVYLQIEETCLRLLIGCVARNERTVRGDTPLHIACSEANSRCIEGILHLKPNTNVQNHILYTPLHSFLKRPPRNEAILRKLLDAGANPNIADADGNSPLHTLALQPETDKTRIFVSLLVEHKANVNSTNDFKETPLHNAIYEGNEGYVKILLESGASINFPDVSRTTPMDIALEKRSRHPRVFETMSKHLILRYYCGFPVNLSHLEEVLTSETCQLFKTKCEEEIQQLKSTRIGDSTVTFYNILVSSTHAVARFLFNVNGLVSLQAFVERESIFGPVLNKKFNEALERFHVLQIGIFAARKTFPFLPDTCIYKLVEYLDIDDFINLHECFSSRKSNIVIIPNGIRYYYS